MCRRGQPFRRSSRPSRVASLYTSYRSSLVQAPPLVAWRRVQTRPVPRTARMSLMRQAVTTTIDRQYRWHLACCLCSVVGGLAHALERPPRERQPHRSEQSVADHISTSSLFAQSKQGGDKSVPPEGNFFCFVPMPRLCGAAQLSATPRRLTIAVNQFRVASMCASPCPARHWRRLAICKLTDGPGSLYMRFLNPITGCDLPATSSSSPCTEAKKMELSKGVVLI